MSTLPTRRPLTRRTSRALSRACMEALEPRVLLSAASLFHPAVSYATGDQPCAVAVGDFNHDGKMDLVTVNASSTLDPGTMSILLGKGDGTFNDATAIATDIDPAAVVVGRFNNDAFDDIAVPCYDSATGGGGTVLDVFLGKGDGTFQAPATLATPASPTAIAKADFNHDGYDDLVVTGEEADLDQNVAIYLASSSGSGDFSLKATYASYWAEGVAVANFDGDANVNLAVVDQWDAGHSNDYHVTLFQGQGDGTFQVKDSYALGYGATDITSADFNGDGHSDLAVTCYNDSKLNILLGAGDGTFAAHTDFDSGLDPGGVAVSDFDNDGFPDPAIASWGGSTVRVKLGDGTGGFRDIGAEEIDAGAGPSGIAIADFNGDRLMDVATADQQGGDVSVLLGAGPTAADLGFMLNRNATFTFSKKIFTTVYSDSNQLALAQLKIVSLPVDGIIKFRGKPVTAGQMIPASQLGNLNYVLNKNYDGTDTFTWRVFDSAAYSGLFTTKFVTTPEATIISGGPAREGLLGAGIASRFTVQLNHAALTDLSINLVSAGNAVGKKHYVKMPSKITIPAGATSSDITLTPLFAAQASGDLNVIEKLAAGKGYTIGAAKSATDMIVDLEPKLTVTPSVPATHFLAAVPAEATFTLSAPLSQDLVLTLVVGGTARNGKDYALLPKTVTIPAGSTSVTIEVTPLLNPLRTKTITLSCKVITGIFSLDPLAKSAQVNIVHAV